ncbi:MAG: transaldolase family protein, partial [Promethearchaeota archaeon]
SPNIVIKIPFIKEGIKAVKILEAEGIKTNVTLVFSQNQVLIAAKAGASFISPFIGRLMDNGQNEIDFLWECMEILNAYNFKSELIVASIRNTRHLIDSAKMGAHIATIPFNVLDKMFKHPNTDQGLEAFLKDWEKLQKELNK